MGLDQYAFIRVEDGEGKDDALIMQWRKHSNLEGRMSDLYHARGGTSEFNCVELQLFAEDLEKLESEHRNLEPASGFFWGQSTLEDVEDTQAFIDAAKVALKNGHKIIYTSWW